MLTCRVVDTADNTIVDLDWISASSRHELMSDGGWEVTAFADPDVLSLLESRTEQYWVILADHSSGHVHGGPIREIRWTGVGADAKFVVRGGNCNWLLNTTVTLPSVTQTFYPGAPPRADQTYTRASQYISASLYELVDDQVNNTGISYRNLDVSLTGVSSLNIGRQAPVEALPFEPLMETIRRWSLYAGLVSDFQLRGNTTTAEMSIRLPNERTFVLSERDGVLVDWEYFEQADTLNLPWMGGNGEGVDREVLPVAPAGGLAGIPARWGVTIERFVNASSTANSTELRAAGDAVILDNLAQHGVKTKALASRMGVEFGVDFLLGDIVNAVFLDVAYRQIITAVEVEWTVAGKNETIETGEPPMWMTIIGGTLGRQTAATYGQSAGLTAGDLTLDRVFTAGDSAVYLDFEIVYAEGEAATIDQATWTLQRRIDGGSWTSITTAAALGTEDLSYSHVTFSTSVPAYTDYVEWRVLLEKSGETDDYSSVYTVGLSPTLSFSLLQSPNQSVGLSSSMRASIPDAVPAGTVMNIERSVDGSGTWADDTGSADYTFTSTFSGTIDRTVTHDTAGDWLYRFTLTKPDTTVLTSSETAVVTVTGASRRVTSAGDERITSGGDGRITS